MTKNLRSILKVFEKTRKDLETLVKQIDQDYSLVSGKIDSLIIYAEDLQNEKEGAKESLTVINTILGECK